MESASNSPLVSVALIVRNAADTIERTLASVAPLADEIVICDTGSTDGTLALARCFSPRIIERPWLDDYSRARNECWNHARGQWIFWIDAAETIAPETAFALRQFIESEAQPSRVYLLPIQVPPSTWHISGEQVLRPRLIPNLPKLRFTGRVRESLHLGIAQCGLELEVLPWVIERGMLEHDPQVKQRKARRDARLAAREIEQHGASARMLNCLGEAYQTLGDKHRAVESFTHAVQTAEAGTTDLLEAYYGLLTSLEGLAGGREAQLSACLKALETFPLDAQLLCAMGGYLQAQGRLDLATRAYQTAYEFGQINPETWHLQDIDQVAAVCYSLALQMQDREDDACDMLEEMLARKADSPRARRRLLDLWVKRGHGERALHHARKLPAASAEEARALETAVRGGCLAAEKGWKEAKTLLADAFTQGCRESICLRWFTVTLMALADFKQAAAVIAAWKAREPLSVEVHQYEEALARRMAEEPPAKPSEKSARPPMPHLSLGAGAGMLSHSPS